MISNTYYDATVNKYKDIIISSYTKTCTKLTPRHPKELISTAVSPNTPVIRVDKALITPTMIRLRSFGYFRHKRILQTRIDKITFMQLIQYYTDVDTEMHTFENQDTVFRRSRIGVHRVLVII